MALKQLTIRGAAEIAAHEALVPMPYRDSVGVWTIGIGHTAAAGAPDPAKLPKGVEQPIEEMVALFMADLERYEADVLDVVKVPLAEHELAALVSFHFNTGAIRRASLVKALNAGDRAEAARRMALWNKPAEIVGRRRREVDLFRNGNWSGGGVFWIYPADAAGRVQWRKGRKARFADHWPARPAPLPPPIPDAPSPKPAPPRPGFWQRFAAALLRRLGA